MNKTAENLAFVIFAFVAVLVIALVFCACTIAPRSATMCLNAQNKSWVQCPAGFKAGETIPKSNIKEEKDNAYF